MTASFIQWFNDMALLGSFVVLNFFHVNSHLHKSDVCSKASEEKSAVKRESFFLGSHLLSQQAMVYFYESFGSIRMWSFSGPSLSA